LPFSLSDRLSALRHTPDMRAGTASQANNIELKLYLLNGRRGAGFAACPGGEWSPTLHEGAGLKLEQLHVECGSSPPFKQNGRHA